MRAWLRRWLGIPTVDSIGALFLKDAQLEQTAISHAKCIHALQDEIRELRAEVTRLQIAQYVPPQTPEPEKKPIIRTQTFKQFTDIVEREQETSDAV